MQTYQDIKTKHSNAYNNAIEKNHVFFAFNQEQLKEGINKLKRKDKNFIKGDKLVKIFGGGLLPQKNLDNFIKEIKEANTNNKKALKELREEKKEAILYELINHECFYTTELEPVIDFFKGIYTAKVILKVYNDNKEEQQRDL